MLLPAMSHAQQPAAAPEAPPDAEALAKKLANPISDLVSVPFQFNFEQGVGPNDATRFILNIQPVMPFVLTDDLNMIVRVIMPYVGQPALFEGGAPASGLGDITNSYFFSPSKSSLIWGVGPVFVLPTTSEPTLGSGKWSGGPTAVVLKQTGKWTIGALWNQVWSFSGDDSRADVNQMFLQPILAYQATKTITVTLQSETVANWEAEDDDDTWTVPINFLVSKISSFGQFPASYMLGVGYFPEHPATGPSWKLRGMITLLLPRTRR